MTIGQQLRKNRDIIAETQKSISKAIDCLLVLKKDAPNLCADIKETITYLRKDFRRYGNRLTLIDNRIEKNQQICPHEKEGFLGSNHHFDIYKCNECGKERKE